MGRTPIGRRVSRSNRSGLSFPVGRIERHLRDVLNGTGSRGRGRTGKGKHRLRLSNSAPVYLTAVLEYLTGIL